MNANNEYERETIRQKLENSIKKYIKLNRKKNSIENEMETLSRNIEKYKISYGEII